LLPDDLRKAIEARMPKFNPDIANGLAVKHLKYAEEAVDAVWRVAASGFPPGLEYVGCERCTPSEEYAIITRKKGSDCTFDIATNYMYFVKYMFKFNGVPIRPRYQQLPYAKDGGETFISGSRHIISPVLADRVISVSETTIFIRLLQAKNIYHRTPYHYAVNDEKVRREAAQVVWSNIYNGKLEADSSKNRVKAETTIAHYLFCKYGFTETLIKFANCTPITGDESVINELNYPKADWVICSSLGLRPKYVPAFRISPIKVAIKKTEYTPLVKSLIAGFFYCIDRFSIRESHVEIDRPSMWRILLGILLYSADFSEGKLLADINEHISSIDKYVDGIVAEQLERIGYKCTDIYELFALILNKFDDWMLESDQKGNSKYGKELNILYFVLADINRGIFSLYFELRSSKRTALNADKIEQLMAKHIKPGAIYSLNKSHGEVSTGGYSGDNKPLRTTAILVPQAETSNRRQSHTASGKDALLHLSSAEVQVLLSMSKACPSGATRVSPYLQIDDTGLILRNEDLRALIDQAQETISRPSGLSIGDIRELGEE
jgi:hypothetical protein